jgi:hypothetical protein
MTAEPLPVGRAWRDRAAAFFLTPATPTAPAFPAASRTVVVGSEHDVPPLAAAVALSLRAAGRAPAAVVALWRAAVPDAPPPATVAPGGPATSPASRGPATAAAPPPAACPSRGPATFAASRLASRLARRGLAAAPRGRLVWVALPADAATVVGRVAAALDVPLVTALAGPRPGALDALVDDHDLVVVAADPETPLGRAATAALAHRPASTFACAPVRRGLPRALALAGIAAPRLEPPLRLVRSETP